MSTEILTLDAGTERASETPRAFLVIHVDGDPSSRVVDLPPEVEVTFGRSRGATMTVDHEKVSRLHTRVRWARGAILVEDLGSRNGTWVNGVRIATPTRVANGDEIAIGPIHAVVGLTSGLQQHAAVASADACEARLIAEVDRSVRYHRPLAIASVRIADDAALDAIARGLRPMDLIGDDIGDDYLIILPELDRAAATAALAKLEPRPTATALAIVPDDATTVDAAVARLRALRRGAPIAPAVESVQVGPAIVIDPAMRRVYELAARIADSTMTVLIYGETGAGKELVAEAIHRGSSRRDKPFVKLNCAALPENLLESELFGYERGAFTGADRRKVGYFEAADGGTLFLDEIGEMPPALQAKLLRVLERKQIVRVGSTTELAVDTRVVVATHRDLDAAVRTGRFRQDLLFRIGGFTIAIPPLRDRPDEILPLAEHFIRQCATESGRSAPSLSPAARDALVGYSWPGNVRELRNAIERALVLGGEVIGAADLPDRLLDDARRVRPVATASSVRGQLAEVERTAIVAALEADGHNQTRAARRLGLSRRALIYKMEKYGLKPPPTREG